MRTLLICGFLALSLPSCAHRPVSTNWRFITKDSADFLLPPGPANPDLAVKLPPTPVSTSTDLIPPARIQVVSPFLHDDNAPVIEEAGPAVETAAGLNVALRFTNNVIGYETALYAVQPKAASPGYSITAVSAERHIGRDIERAAQPATNYFDFPPDAAFFRLFSNQVRRISRPSSSPPPLKPISTAAVRFSTPAHRPARNCRAPTASLSLAASQSTP